MCSSKRKDDSIELPTKRRIISSPNSHTTLKTSSISIPKMYPLINPVLQPLEIATWPPLSRCASTSFKDNHSQQKKKFKGTANTPCRYAFLGPKKNIFPPFLRLCPYLFIQMSPNLPSPGSTPTNNVAFLAHPLSSCTISHTLFGSFFFSPRYFRGSPICQRRFIP